MSNPMDDLLAGLGGSPDKSDVEMKNILRDIRRAVELQAALDAYEFYMSDVKPSAGAILKLKNIIQRKASNFVKHA